MWSHFFSFLIFFSVTLTMFESSEDNSTILGHANVDLFPLCTSQIEERSSQLIFHRNPKQQTPIHRRIPFKAAISSDQPFLKTPLRNCLHVTFDSICNMELEAAETSTIKIGFMAPTGSEVILFHLLHSLTF